MEIKQRDYIDAGDIRATFNKDIRNSYRYSKPISMLIQKMQFMFQRPYFIPFCITDV